jgi:hypothetical protein
VVGILKNASPPPNNTSRSLAEFEALRVLRHNTDIAILPADKGRATVVLDTQDYNGKLRAIV